MTEQAKNPPLPDYFELLRAMTGGSPAAAGFAGLGGAAAAFAAMAPLKVEDIDRKIRELEVVQMWLRGQATAVELSIHTLQFQRDAVKHMDAAGAATTPAYSPEDIAKFASAFNPGAWMAQMMPAASTDKAATPPKRAKQATKKRAT